MRWLTAFSSPRHPLRQQAHVDVELDAGPARPCLAFPHYGSTRLASGRRQLRPAQETSR